MKTQLPKELIEDYKSNVQITDLCRKYELSREIIRNQLIKMGVREKTTWGGRRKGCGRKRCKKDRGSEIRAIRDKNAKLNKPIREGVKAKPKFKLW